MLSALQHYGRLVRMFSELSPRVLPLLVVGSVSAGLATLAHADEADVINFSATSSTLRDDNLYRAPKGGATPIVSDVIQTSTLGLRLKKKFSLQELSANVSLADTRYRDHDALNRKAFNYDARWAWGLTRRLTGDLSVDHAEAQNSFSQYQYQASNQRNTRTTESQRFNLDYWMHSSWHAIGGVYRQSMSNELAVYEESDFEVTGAYLGVRFAPSSGNSLSLKIKQSEGRYVKRAFNTALQFDNAYSEPGYDLAVDWRLSGKTSVNATVGYLSREHEHFSSRDYQGWTGQMGVRYNLTAKTVLAANYQRGLAAAQSNTNSYTVLDDYSLNAQWQATQKIGLGASLAYSKRSYLGEIVPLAPGTERRIDRQRRAGLNMNWKPTRWLDVRTGFEAEQRDSTGTQFDYLDRRWTLAATANF